MNHQRSNSRYVEHDLFINNATSSRDTLAILQSVFIAYIKEKIYRMVNAI